MQFSELPLAGAYHIRLDKREDERGSFYRCFDEAEMHRRGLVSHFAQHSISENLAAGTLRGLHFQREPHAETKLIQCIRGRVFDVIVDLRKDSATYRQHCHVVLSAAEPSMLYVPKGFAHGFLTLEENSHLHYQISEPYSADAAGGIRWDDPKLAINWPQAPEVISARDSELPYLSD